MRDRPRVLLVEDDAQLSVLLGRVLHDEGYDITVAADGQHGLHVALTREFDVMVVDRGLPVIEGLDLVTRLRSRGIVTPLLVLSARGTAADRVDGLDAGAEDYLAKPFDLNELLARLRALRRRHRDSAAALPVPGGQLMVDAHAVRRHDDELVELSRAEAAMLAMLARRPAQVFTRRELLRGAFDDAESEGTVDLYVHYLRRKLGRDVVRTVRGLGYRLGRQ